MVWDMANNMYLNILLKVGKMVCNGGIFTLYAFEMKGLRGALCQLW